MRLSIDFETRSTVDLRKTGVYRYAEDPSTDVWCMAYALDDGPVKLWVPGDDVRDHAGLVVALPRPDLEVRAWNALFERIIWREIMVKRYGFPEVPLEQWWDTAADAAALALPRALGKAAHVLGLPVEKDMEGRRLMLQMAKPRQAGAYVGEGFSVYRRKQDVPKGVRVTYDPEHVIWWDEPEKREALYEYCRQDVVVERAILGALPRKLSRIEREVYLMDQRMNDRGVRIDRALVESAMELNDRAVAEANAALETLTDGAVDAVTKHAAMRGWLNDNGLPEVESVAKDVVRDLIAELDAREGLSEEEQTVLQVLRLRAENAKSSTAKMRKMLECVCGDDRARGLHLYLGASTGRWAGKLIQPQNFPRPELRDIESYIDLVLEGEYHLIDMEHPVPVVVASMLRSMLVAGEGRTLLGGDFAQIEARVLAWLAEQEDLVQLFAGGGKVYEDMASYIFSIPIEEIAKDSFERQIGKNSVLGAGFQMGADRFAEQVWEQTGIVLDRGRDWHCECGADGGTWATGQDKEKTCECGKKMELVLVREDIAAKAIDGYRAKNHRIKAFWGEIEAAAIAAIREPGTVHRVGRGGCVAYTVRGPWLWCQLPSGRFLAYALPDIREKRLPEPYQDIIKPSATYMGVDSMTRKWRRQYTYGGHLTENVVQAIARDLLAMAMLRAERAGYEPVLTVHDEQVVEAAPDADVADFEALMARTPAWAEGLPVEVEAWRGERYRK